MRYARLVQSAQYWHLVLIRLLPALSPYSTLLQYMIISRYNAPTYCQTGTNCESWDWTSHGECVVAARMRQKIIDAIRVKGKRCHFYCTSLVLDNAPTTASSSPLMPFTGRWFYKSVGRKANGQKTAYGWLLNQAWSMFAVGDGLCGQQFPILISQELSNGFLRGYVRRETESYLQIRTTK